jgi:signal transduction histidine kinase
VITRELPPGEEWARTIVDAGGTVVARTRDAERFVGGPATPPAGREAWELPEVVTRDRAMLGHELRNPLSPIVTALQLLKLRGEGQNREHGIIARQVQHLTRLVDDLLDVSCIARGLISLSQEHLDARAARSRFGCPPFRCRRLSRPHRSRRGPPPLPRSVSSSSTTIGTPPRC